jgi:hypothetical protein
MEDFSALSVRKKGMQNEHMVRRCWKSLSQQWTGSASAVSRKERKYTCQRAMFAPLPIIKEAAFPFNGLHRKSNTTFSTVGFFALAVRTKRPRTPPWPGPVGKTALTRAIWKASPPYRETDNKTKPHFGVFFVSLIKAMFGLNTISMLRHVCLASREKMKKKIKEKGTRATYGG